MGDPFLSVGREFVKLGEGTYRFRIDSTLCFTASRVRWERNELKGFLRVECELVDVRTYNGILCAAEFSFTDLRARAFWTRELNEAIAAEEVDVRPMLHELCTRVIDAETVGQDVVLLKDVVPDGDGGVKHVDGFPVLLRQPSMLFGDGGTGKSTLALHIAGELERQGVSVLFLDWEQDASDHRRQLERLFGPDMPDLKYHRCRGPLVVEAEGLAEKVAQCGIEFVICDSVAFACDGPPESAEVAQRYFRSLRQLGVGSLSLAHVTKGDENDKRPFGSTFWFNGSRSVWYAKRADGLSGPGEIEVGLFDRKFNLGSRRQSLAYRIRFGERIEVRQTNVTENPALVAELPTTQRLRLAVMRRPKKLHELADELGARVGTLERYVRRDPNLTFRDGSDGVKEVVHVGDSLRTQ